MKEPPNVPFPGTNTPRPIHFYVNSPLPRSTAGTGAHSDTPPMEARDPLLLLLLPLGSPVAVAVAAEGARAAGAG